ncbi:MAG: hypothetical protein UZ08_BCD001001719 [Candidatus Parvibacillus calidus]|nr:MAG: hypothetical protein UZ08_BCD001001719 [Candidatus Parvibacillus calidus]
MIYFLLKLGKFLWKAESFEGIFGFGVVFNRGVGTIFTGICIAQNRKGQHVE